MNCEICGKEDEILVSLRVPGRKPTKAVCLECLEAATNLVKRKGNREPWSLRCPKCGRRVKFPATCPNCFPGSSHQKEESMAKGASKKVAQRSAKAERPEGGAVVTIKCEGCQRHKPEADFVNEETLLVEALCQVCRKQATEAVRGKEPPAPSTSSGPAHIPDDVAAGIFEARQRVSVAAAALEGATSARKMAAGEYDSAVTALMEALDDARSGQTRLFGKEVQPA